MLSCTVLPPGLWPSPPAPSKSLRDPLLAPTRSVGAPQGSVLNLHASHWRTLSSKSRASITTTGIDIPRYFPGPEFILNSRPWCPVIHFTFPADCLKSCLHKTCLKPNLWLSALQVRKLGTILIGSPSFSLASILFNSQLYWHNCLHSSSPPNSISTTATLHQTPATACLRIPRNFSCLPPLSSQKNLSKYKFYQYLPASNSLTPFLYF